ncbi:MAG: class I SAM-dependent methyltransferase [Candidatus Zixiibacteriota bacterium]
MSSKNPEWFYDEMKQVGVDFDSVEQVEKYDREAAVVRKPEAEAAGIANAVGLQSHQVVLEFGSGTGEIAIQLAGKCRKVIAADVSGTMLKYAEQKARDGSVTNIEFLHTGFLNYRKQEDVDVILTQIALHHLPDFWKMIAIQNMYDALKDGGRLLLRDSILSFDTKDYINLMNGFILMAEKYAGSNKAREMVLNIREEYPTFDWAIEEMLKRAGFRIDSVERHGGYFATFVCTKCQIPS